MKQIFTLIIAIFASLTIFAYPSSTRLTVSTFNNQSIGIMVDGRMVQQRQNDNTYVINDLPAGYHSIKIYQQRGNGRRRNNSNQLIYNGNIYVKRGYHTDITINRFGKAFVDEQMIGSEYYQDEDNDWGNNDIYQPMNSRSFEQLKQTIVNESFDNTKMSIAKSGIAANYFSAAQAKQIVQLFSFENSKLEIAKYLYKYTVDKNNYITVYDALTYSSSKEELARYIQQYR